MSMINLLSSKIYYFLIINSSGNVTEIEISVLRDLGLLNLRYKYGPFLGILECDVSMINLRFRSPKSLSTEISISPKETKRFYPFTVIILRIWKGHGARALFSPISLPAT